MILLLLAYAGGILTILSPCILPVLPLVFARADGPFIKSGLPLLLGMALTFAGVATLAAVGGGWAVQANQYGRIGAMILLALFGITLLFPALATALTRPLVAAGSRLSESLAGPAGTGPSFATSFLLGIATGLLWAPCAGPILGLVLTGAALGGASVHTSLLLFAYAAGAATSLALALLIGGRVFKAMKRSLGAGEWIRRGLGAALLGGVAAIALGVDTGFLTRLSLSSTSGIEQTLIDKIKGRAPADAAVRIAGGAASNTAASGPAAQTPAPAGATLALADEGDFPPLNGAVQWLNSPPLTRDALRGKVVLIDFWTYSCINCLRALPYVRAWADKYKSQGLVVIGVHAPEFAFEKNIGNVRKAIKDLNVDYPVAIDNNFAIWRAFDNHYWPAHYFIDARGRVRYHHFGEGEYDQSERVIQQLLAEAGHGTVAHGLVSVSAHGVQAAPDDHDVKSQETYIGYARASGFAAPGGAVHDRRHHYLEGSPAALNTWSLAGDWTVEPERAVLEHANGRIAYRFHARDLHLVLGEADPGKPVRFRVLVDGEPPAASHGADTDAQGYGVVDGQRLYQLVRQDGPVRDRLFEIEFLDPRVQAFAFTFG